MTGLDVIPTRLWDWLPALLAVALLAAAPLLGFELRRHAAPVAFVDKVAVEASATPAILGWRELGQHPGPRSASRQHLLVDRRDGSWVIGNRSQDRRVLARTTEYESRYIQRWPLAEGDVIALPEAAFEVTGLSDSRIALRDTESGRSVVWEGGGLDPQGEPVYTVCLSTWQRIVLKIRWLFRNVATSSRPEFSFFSIGGNVNCTNRWKVPSLPPEAVDVVWQGGRFWLAPAMRRFDVLMQHKGGPRIGFNDLTLPIDGPEGRLERIIVGRTVYDVDAETERLTLTPVANMELWFDETPEGSYVHRAWAGDGAQPETWLRAQRFWLLPGFLAVVLVAVGVAIYWSRRRYIKARWLIGSLVGVLPAIMGGWLTVLMLRGAIEPDVMLRVGMVWLAWTWASLVMLFGRRLVGVAGWIWVAATFLAFTGLLVLLQLGAGAENTRWMSYVIKQSFFLAAFGWTVAAMAAVPGEAWRRVWLWLFGNEPIVAVVAALLAVLMFLQLAIGTEEGVAGIQPVEFTKTIFVVLLGFVGMHFTEVRRRESRAYSRSPIVFLLPFLRFIGIFFLVVLSLIVGVRDFSPMIIIGLVTLSWLWKVGTSQGEQAGAAAWFLVRPAVVVVLAAIIGVGAYAHSNPASLPHNMPQRDRILVWAEPDLHPHSGSQVLSSMDRVGEGGWFGEVAWFGSNGKVMDVPAVQDDFTLAFLLHRFGGVPGLALLLVQLLYVAALLSLSRRIEAFTAAGDFAEQSAGLVLGYTVFGLAWMQVAHWLIAWCNALGLLPVMGQPMTWLSAGNSHMIGFALMTLTIALVTAWILRVPREEA